MRCKVAAGSVYSHSVVPGGLDVRSYLGQARRGETGYRALPVIVSVYAAVGVLGISRYRRLRYVPRVKPTPSAGCMRADADAARGYTLIRHVYKLAAGGIHTCVLACTQESSGRFIQT